MNLKTAERILLIICGCIAVFLFLGDYMDNVILMYLSVACAFLAIVFWLIFGRCPNCGKYLGRCAGKHCPHCGEKIE